MVRRSVYAPERGDLVWLAFDPQAGREMRGRRPALTLSPRAYNALVGLAIFCPITSQVKGYPYEVALPARGKVVGVVLADQVRSLDWRARDVQFAARAPDQVIEEVLDKLRTLV
jgi:mRNA interferase MazF